MNDDLEAAGKGLENGNSSFHKVAGPSLQRPPCSKAD